MTDAQRYAWISEHGDEPEASDAATIAVIRAGSETAEELLARLGRAEPQGDLDAEAAEEIGGRFWDDDTETERGVVQLDRLPGDGGDWWVTLEPNGYRMESWFAHVAGERPAACLFWNVNAHMSLARADAGQVAFSFDPVVDDDDVPPEGADLPFADDAHAAALALLERWTGVSISREWFVGAKPTYVVHAPPEPPR